MRKSVYGVKLYKKIGAIIEADDSDDDSTHLTALLADLLQILDLRGYYTSMDILHNLDLFCHQFPIFSRLVRHWWMGMRASSKASAVGAWYSKARSR